MTGRVAHRRHPARQPVAGRGRRPVVLHRTVLAQGLRRLLGPHSTSSPRRCGPPASPSVTGRIIGDESRFDSRRTAPVLEARLLAGLPADLGALGEQDLWTFGAPASRPEPGPARRAVFRTALIGAGVTVGQAAHAGGHPARPCTWSRPSTSPTMARLVRQMDRSRTTTSPRCCSRTWPSAAGVRGTTANGVHADPQRDPRPRRQLAGPRASTTARGSPPAIACRPPRSSGPAAQGRSPAVGRLVPRRAAAGRRQRHAQTPHAHRPGPPKRGRQDRHARTTPRRSRATSPPRNGHRILFSMIMNRPAHERPGGHKLQDRICQLLAGSRPTASVSRSATALQLVEIDHRHAQLLGLGPLRAAALAGQQVARWTPRSSW